MKMCCLTRLSLASAGTLMAGFAQAADIDVDSKIERTLNANGTYTYTTWKPIIGAAGGANTSGGFLVDYALDQQTGQNQADFVSSAANPGFFIQFGTINTVDHLAFRVVLNEARTIGNMPNIFFGFDAGTAAVGSTPASATLDGKVDLILGLSQQSNSLGLVFFAPGTGANSSPNTTTFGNAFYVGANRASGMPALNSPASTTDPTKNQLTLDSTGFNNFSNITLQDGVNKVTSNGAVPANNLADYYPGWTTQAESNGTSLDSMVTFAFPLADINAALGYLGTGLSVTSSTLMRWIAMTSTQNNSINQDAYGTNNNATLFADYLTPMDPMGRPIPEPATFGLCFGAGLAGFLGLRRRPARPRAA